MAIYLPISHATYHRTPALYPICVRGRAQQHYRAARYTARPLYTNQSNACVHIVASPVLQCACIKRSTGTPSSYLISPGVPFRHGRLARGSSAQRWCRWPTASTMATYKPSEWGHAADITMNKRAHCRSPRLRLPPTNGLLTILLLYFGRLFM